MNDAFDQARVESWIASGVGEEERRFRKAVHIILCAISEITSANEYQMVLKGGILASLRYETQRETRDIDFSTGEMYSSFIDKQAVFLEKFQQKINRIAVERESYGLALRIQNVAIKPPDKPGRTRTFPALHITIGYANKSDKREMNRLDMKNSPAIVSIDYSFNEPVRDSVDTIILDEEGRVIKTYSRAELISEKLRAILQQTVRNRARGQDVFDIFFLLRNGETFDEEEKERILELLIEKSAARGIGATENSIDEPGIKERSQERYEELEKEISGAFLPFETAFSAVRAFYKSLPWRQS
jgi:predicted nucleotidyltransferase component of viral defense system